jgi:UDP-GlcNAc:undecaprenyl-phosphate GlcNAc-1-phosphate transferase
LGSCLPIAALWLLGRLGLIDDAVNTRDAVGVLLAGGGMAATGLCDDLYRLSPVTKFLMQLLITLLVIALGIRFESLAIPFWGSLTWGLFLIPLTLLWLTGFANIYNFMDGINGLAAGTGAVYACFFYLLGWRLGNQGLAAVAVILAGSCLGFLFHNFPQARTFMGDTGSLFLGVLFALLVVQNAQRSSDPGSLTALLLVCSVFLYDSIFTLLRRIRYGENIFRAHRSHLYQRLVQAGLSHGKVTGLYLLLHALMGFLALAYLSVSGTDRVWIPGFALLVFLVFTLGVCWFERRTAKLRC